MKVKLYKELKSYSQHYRGWFLIKDVNNKWILANPRSKEYLRNPSGLNLLAVIDNKCRHPAVNDVNSLYGHLLNDDMDNLNIVELKFKLNFQDHTYWKLNKDSYFFFFQRDFCYNKVLRLQRQQKINKNKAVINKV